MQNKGFWAIVAILIIGAVGAIVFANRAEAPQGTADKDRLAVVQEGDHVRGKADSSVVLIEYGDIECPSCALYDPVAEALVASHGDKVAFVFRHFPITNKHPYAMIAARAAEAGGKQNKFFELTHLMYQRQQQWSAVASQTDPTNTFVTYAQELGLDADKFRAAMADPSTLDYVNRQRDEASVFDVTGTPTLILNGEKVEVRSLEQIQSLLDQKLQETSKS
jgi:protein-disulfide isomerase